MDTQESKTAEPNYQLQQTQEELQTKNRAEDRETWEKSVSEMGQRSRELSSEVDNKSKEAEMLAQELVSLPKIQNDTAIVSNIIDIVFWLVVWQSNSSSPLASPRLCYYRTN